MMCSASFVPNSSGSGVLMTTMSKGLSSKARRASDTLPAAHTGSYRSSGSISRRDIWNLAAAATTSTLYVRRLSSIYVPPLQSRSAQWVYCCMIVFGKCSAINALDAANDLASSRVSGSVWKRAFTSLAAG